LGLDLGKALMQALAQLAGLVLAVRAALAHDDCAGGGDARETGQSDELPGDTHRAVGYAR
jgi:hypothetical protein